MIGTFVGIAARCKGTDMQGAGDVRVGALVGFATTVALAGVLYLLAQLQVVAFIPLDIAEAIVQLTPGTLATRGIEVFGPVAKILIEISGMLAFLLAGTAVGALLARRRGDVSLAIGLLAGTVGFGLTLIAQFFAANLPDPRTLGLTALLLGGWGLLLAVVLRRACAGPPASDRSASPAGAWPDRRAFLRRSSGVLLTVAVGSAAVGELLRRAADAQLGEQGAAGGANAF